LWAFTLILAPPHPECCPGELFVRTVALPVMILVDLFQK
jgi:hypothetical protein